MGILNWLGKNQKHEEKRPNLGPRTFNFLKKHSKKQLLLLYVLIRLTVAKSVVAIPSEDNHNNRPSSQTSIEGKNESVKATQDKIKTIEDKIHMFKKEKRFYVEGYHNYLEQEKYNRTRDHRYQPYKTIYSEITTRPLLSPEGKKLMKDLKGARRKKSRLEEMLINKKNT